MKRLAMPALLALLSVSMAVPGCAGKFPSDLWPALKACGSSDVTWQAATQVFGDLIEIADGNPAGEADLLALLAADVGGGIPCLVNYFEHGGGPAGAAATKFKAAHAKEMRAAAARGPSACRSPGDSTPPTGPTVFQANPGDRLPGASPAAGGAQRVPAAGPKMFAYPGANPGAELSACEATCGGDALAPPDGCLCRRKIGGVARWVAVR